MKFFRPTLVAKQPHAFSLVEVAFSLGLVAFGLTAILGLMPLGLSQFREAMDVTISSQISSVVSSDIKQTPFETLVDTTAVLPPRYFNDQGIEVQNERDGVYAALATVVQGVNIPPAITNQNVARVRLEITAHRGVPGQATTAQVLSRTAFVVADRK